MSVGTVALDGTLIAGNASRAATRTQVAIREEVERILAEAGQVDAAEDAAHGDARGDELPQELVDRRSRIERLRRCRQQLEAEQAQAQAAYEENLYWRAEWEAEHGRKLGGRKPTPPDPDALAKRTINTTDPDTRPMRRAGGKAVQGYNAQAVASPEQIILAAETTQQSNDSGQLEPMITTALGELERAGQPRTTHDRDRSETTTRLSAGFVQQPRIAGFCVSGGPAAATGAAMSCTELVIAA